MKSYFAAIFFFLFAEIISAQDVKWSPLIEDKDFSYLKIIGQNDEGFYVLKSNISFEDERNRVGFRNRHYGIAFFTSEMSLKWTHPLEPPVKDGKIVSINMVNEKVLVTFSFADKKEKVYRLMAQYLNNDGEYAYQTDARADSSNIIAEENYDKIDGKEKPDVFISKNHHRIACAYKNLSENKEEQSYHVIILDTTLTVIYKKDFTVPYSEKKFVSENLVLSNEGGFYLFGTRYSNDKKTKVPGESIYLMYHCDKPGGDVLSEEINSATQPASAENKKFIISASPTYDNINHKIVVAGFYSAGSANAIAGTFYYALRTDTLQKTEVRTEAFDENFMGKFHRIIRKNNNELADYSINRITLRRDGGAVILAEGVSTSYSSYYDYFSRMYITHTYYTYGNIIALSVNPDGSILWSEVISKDQESTDDGGYYSSYCNDIYEDKMFFVYNKYIGDHPSVFLTTVNSKGEQKTDVLFNEEEHVLTIPSEGKQIAEDELVMPALKEGKMRFVKITF